MMMRASQRVARVSRAAMSFTPGNTPASHLSGRKYDAIIVGGGHNGLVASCYLAAAGKRVCVLERRSVLGGAAITEEIVPGFKFSRASYVNSLFRPEIIDDLDLKRHGLRFHLRNPSSFTPTEDGRSLLLGADGEENARQISQFSAKDAEAFAKYEDKMTEIVSLIEPLIDLPPPSGFGGSTSLSPKETVKNLRAFADVFRKFNRSSLDIPQLVEFFTAPAGHVLNKWFETDVLKATLATDSIIGAMNSPFTPGSSYVLLHHVMGGVDGHKGVWANVRGGMGALSAAIASAAADRGVDLVTDATVDGIEVRNGRAVGVRVNGQVVEARTVLSNATPHVTFERLLPRDLMPSWIQNDVQHFDYTPSATKINIALDRLPSFSAIGRKDAHTVPGPEHRGTIHFETDMKTIHRAYLDACCGRPSERPVVEMVIPSALDDSLAPPGKHVALVFAQYTPYELANGSWDDQDVRQRFVDSVFDTVESFAPGFRDSVLGYDMLTPVDLERVFGLTRGNIFHGSLSLNQIYFLRPSRGMCGYRTPVPGLYMCGSGAHPGGGVMGAVGRNAARAVLTDEA